MYIYTYTYTYLQFHFSNSLIILLSQNEENHWRGRCLEIGGRKYKDYAKFHFDFVEECWLELGVWKSEEVLLLVFELLLQNTGLIHHTNAALQKGCDSYCSK